MNERERDLAVYTNIRSSLQDAIDNKAGTLEDQRNRQHNAVVEAVANLLEHLIRRIESE